MNLLNLFNGQPKIFDVSSVKYKKPIDDQIITKLTAYCQLSYKHLSKTGLQKIMVGIDEEINALVAAKLLKQAIGEGVSVMIFDMINPVWTESIVRLCQQLNLAPYILNRRATYQNELTTYRLNNLKNIRHFHKRFVNYHLFIQADMMKVALVDTIDKSDRLLGTKPAGFYGYFMPFYPLYKSEILELAKYLGIPDQFISAPALADLPYPADVVLTWDKIDPLLFLLTEKQLTAEEISQQFNIDLHWLKRLKSRIDKQLFQTTVNQFII